MDVAMFERMDPFVCRGETWGFIWDVKDLDLLPPDAHLTYPTLRKSLTELISLNQNPRVLEIRLPLEIFYEPSEWAKQQEAQRQEGIRRVELSREETRRCDSSVSQTAPYTLDSNCGGP